jgi:protein SCO1/2
MMTHFRYAAFIAFSLFFIGVGATWASEENVSTQPTATDNPSKPNQAANPAKHDYHRSELTVTAPDMLLKDQYGSDVQLTKLLAGKDLLAINFIFTSCPSVCPIYSATFARIQSQVDMEKSGLQLLSVSIDPSNDTPEVLKSYAEKFKAGKNWSFLTGSINDIDGIQRAFNAYRGEKMNHPQVIFLHGKGSDTWIKLDGMVDAKTIISELAQLGSVKLINP